MLYDQALLCLAYTEAWATTGEEIFRRTAMEIITYVLRDMTDPAGGFYTAEDADSEGEEGKFYLWTVKEIESVLGKEEAALFSEAYGLEEEGNFVEEATGRRTGENILHRLEAARATTGRELPADHREERLAKAREKLFAVRSGRIRPTRDDKILTDWNGLMIAALARAAAVFSAPAYYDAARRAVDFVWERMVRTDGALGHRWRDGEALAVSFLDDYAFLSWGLLNCFDYTGDPLFLERVRGLQGFLDTHFRDERQGGYYLTPDSRNDVPLRAQEHYDGAIPAGNSVIFDNLLRLHRLTGEEDYAAGAEMLGRAFSTPIAAAPSAHTMFMTAIVT